jgi:hypothetical protein
MAVGVTLDFKGTLAQYDDVIAKMGFSPGGAGAPGSMSIGSPRPTTESA